MCGIFGAIGKVNPYIIRALTLANRERGTDSLGFWTPANSFRRAGDPLEVLSDDDCLSYLDKAHKGWFLAGHTRQATRGAATKRNAHPFRYGRIIGAHNGIVDAPRSYDVDSMVLFDLLNKHSEEGYQKALENLSGYWGLSWFDGQNFWLQAHNNEIAIGRLGKTFYYSSDWSHLRACCGTMQDETILSDGATLKFDCKGGMRQTKNFKSKARGEWWESAEWYGEETGVKITPLKRGKGNGKGKTAPVLTSLVELPPKGTSAALVEVGSNHPDPFYVGGEDGREENGDDRWNGIDDWSEYTRDYN